MNSLLLPLALSLQGVPVVGDELSSVYRAQFWHPWQWYRNSSAHLCMGQHWCTYVGEDECVFGGFWSIISCLGLPGLVPECLWMKLEGWPFSFTVCSILSSSTYSMLLYRYDTLLALYTRVLISATSSVSGWCDVKVRHWLLCVTFLFTDVLVVLLMSLHNCSFRKR